MEDNGDGLSTYGEVEEDEAKMARLKAGGGDRDSRIGTGEYGAGDGMTGEYEFALVDEEADAARDTVGDDAATN